MYIRMKFRVFSLVLGIGVLLLLIYFSNWEEVLASIGNADFAYIASGIFLAFLLMSLKAVRWRYLLGRAGISLPLRESWYVVMAGMFISNLTPGRLGEPVRSYILKRRDKIPFSRSLPSVLVERIFDLVSLISLGIVGAFVLFPSIGYRDVMLAAILVYFCIILSVVFICSDRGRISRSAKFMYRFLGRISFFRKFEPRLDSIVSNFYRHFLNYKDARSLAVTLVLSLIIWSAEGIVLYLSFRSLGMSPGIPASIVIFSIAMLVAIISFLPGGIGSNEVVMVLLFTSLFSYEVSLSMAAVLIYRLVSFWLNMTVGGICFATKS